MARASFAISNFTAGELSPQLDGRTDLGKYFNGAKTLENFTVFPHGGASRRPGTKFVHEVRSSSTQTRIIPFEFSTTDTYILELSNLKIRFYRDGGIITETAKNITAITKANPAVVTSSSHGFSDGDNVIISGVAGMTEVNGITFKVANSTTNTFSLQDYDGTAINSSSYTTYSSGGTAVRIYEITSPYATADIPNIKFAQSSDIMYLVHPTYSIRKLARTAHTSWTLTEVSLTTGTDITVSAITQANPGVVTTSTNHGLIKDNFITFTSIGGMTQLNGNVYKVGNVLNTFTITGITQANPGVVTTSAAHGLAVGEDVTISGVKGMTQVNDTTFTVGAVPSSTTFNLVDAVGANWNTSAYTAYASAGEVTAPDLKFEINDTDGNNVNTSGYGAFSAGGSDVVTKLTSPVLNKHTGSYPSCVTFFEQRLIFAASDNDPQTLWFSKTDSLEDFTVGSDSADAMTYSIASNKGNAIKYLTVTRSLICGTAGGEFSVTASSSAEPITPTNIQIKKQSSYGSSGIDAVSIGNATMFVQRAKRKVRELVYNYDTDGFIAPDLTILAEHISDSGITEMSYQQEPQSILWCVRTDGILSGLTYARNEQVVGWHRHKLGGVFGEATITVSDYGNIATGTTIIITKSDGTTVTFTSEASSGDAPDETLGFRPNESNDTTADNIYTAVNAHADFTVANPSAAVVTIKETLKTGRDPITITTSDTTRLATTDEGYSVAESVATIPGDLNEDVTYVIVKRTVNGATRRYVEYLQPIDYGSDLNSAFFVDTGLSYSGSATTSMTGLEHLEGESVTILADGSTHPNKSVSGGAITLDRSASNVHIGLGYNSTLQTMRLEAGSQDGTAQGKTKRIHNLTVRLFETVGLLVGKDTSNLDRVPFRSSAAAMDTAVPLFTGDKEIEFDADYDTDGFIVIQQNQPLPMNVIALYPQFSTYDG